MTRRRDWHCRLMAWAASVQQAPYQWGQTDCVSLVCGALGVMSDDPLERPHWADSRTARLARLEVPSFGTLLRSAGLDMVPHTHVQPGDVAVLESPGHRWLTCAVALGNSVLTVHRRLGVRRAPLDEFRDAVWFRLGAEVS